MVALLASEMVETTAWTDVKLVVSSALTSVDRSAERKVVKDVE